MCFCCSNCDPQKQISSFLCYLYGLVLFFLSVSLMSISMDSRISITFFNYDLRLDMVFLCCTWHLLILYLVLVVCVQFTTGMSLTFSPQNISNISPFRESNIGSINYSWFSFNISTCTSLDLMSY